MEHTYRWEDHPVWDGCDNLFVDGQATVTIIYDPKDPLEFWKEYYPDIAEWLLHSATRFYVANDDNTFVKGFR